VTSIRKKMIVTLLVCLCVLFAAASAALYLYARSALHDQFDESLRTKIVSFAKMVELEREGKIVNVELEFHDFPLPEYQPSPDCEYYEIWQVEGSVLARSSSLGENDLARIGAGREAPALADIVLPDGRQGRAAAIRFHPKGERQDHMSGEGAEASTETPLDMVIARSRENLDLALLTLLCGFAVMGLLLGIGMVFTVRWSVGRGLEPLDSIAGEIAGIDSNDLSRRVTTDSLPCELVPISRRFNELLDRIESAFQRERRFHADIAHELRTPIAELRTLAEVALMAGPESGSMRVSTEGTAGAFFRDVHDIARQMEKMVNTLLALVRCEAARQGVTLETIDLCDLLRNIASPHRENAAQRNITFDLRLPDEALSRCDRTLLSAILLNLFGNAVSHTPEGGFILCELSTGDGELLFRLENTNDQLDGEDLKQMREPFWQKDPSRTAEGRNGLGLSLVAAYAGLLELDVDVSLPKPDLFAVSFNLPAA